jgi:hypothetical protein
MTLGSGNSTTAFRVLHLEGWTLIRARRDVDDAALSELIPMLGALAGPTVLDLAEHGVADAQRAQLVEALVGLAETARLVVVSSRDTERDALEALGMTQVYESLDAAVGVAGAPIIRQADRVVEAGYPASSDVETVAAEDLLGRSGQPRS